MTTRLRNKDAAGGSSANRGCGILFLAVFALLPLAMAVGFAYSMWEGFRAHFAYVEGYCTIVDERLISSTDSDGDTTYRPEFTFELVVGGEEYMVNGFDGVEVSSSGRAGKQRILDRYEVGETYSCFYDPEDPQKAVLEKPGWTRFLILLAPLGFLAIVVALIYFSRGRGKIRAFEKTTPKRAAAPAKASRLTRESEPVSTPAPKSERGRRLSHRLAQEESEKGAAIGLFLFSTIWTAVSAFIFSQALEGSDSFAVVFLGLFVLLGLALLAVAVRQALIAWGTGKTVLELSRAALSPGESFEASIEQHGHMQMNVLEARLICREKAIYRQGTNRRTATEDVFDLPLTRVENARVAGWLVRRFEGRIPRDAMHSFKAGNNEILWLILVTGDIVRWPDFKRSFRLRVLSEGGGG